MRKLAGIVDFWERMCVNPFDGSSDALTRFNKQESLR